MTNKKSNVSRRQFLGAVGAVGAASAFGPAVPSLLAGQDAWKAPRLLDKAPDGDVLRAGLVGCGGRGKGAALNFLDAGDNLEIVALADVFEDRLNDCRDTLKNRKGVEVPNENCFIGFDAYKDLIDCDLDIVLLATPPHFRPEHFNACIRGRKHVFMEKPVCVDPVGARSIMASARKAKAINLSVVTGTQRRHQRDYVATYKKVAEGAIGEIVSANCYWNQSQLWYRTPQEGWTDMEAMIRDWVNWCWLSGDHIVEQHVHNIDVVQWFTGKVPVKAVGFGGRHGRVTGDQYDFFSIDYVYDNSMHVHSMSRQINGCVNNVSETIRGTKGYSNCRNTIWTPDGKQAWKYDYAPDESGKPRKNVKVSPYVQEHIDLVTAIRTDDPINEAEGTAISTLVAIMGRISAYTGKEVTYEQMMKSNFRIGPETYAMGAVDLKADVPVPGDVKKG